MIPIMEEKDIKNYNSYNVTPSLFYFFFTRVTSGSKMHFLTDQD